MPSGWLTNTGSNTLSRRLEVTLEAREVGGPESLIRLRPLRHGAQRPRRDLIQPLTPIAATAPLADQPRVAQHAKMPRDRGAAHRELGRDVGHRRLTVAQPIENGAPGRIGDGVKRIEARARCGHE